MSDIQCPNCSEEVTAFASGKYTTTCPKCQSRLVVDDAKVDAKSAMAKFTETPKAIAVGWPVDLGGKTLRVLGRIQYQYEAGYWDEFHIEFPDRTLAWISVDEGRYLLQQELQVEDINLAQLKSLNAGDSFTLLDETFQVREIGFATMVGMQGQIPFVVEPDEIMHYIQLSAPERELTVEVFGDGSYDVFEGFRLEPDELKPASHSGHSSSQFHKIYSPPVFDDPEETDSASDSRVFSCSKCS